MVGSDEERPDLNWLEPVAPDVCGGTNEVSIVDPLSALGQYLSLSCWARSFSPTGGLSRASVRMSQV